MNDIERQQIIAQIEWYQQANEEIAASIRKSRRVILVLIGVIVMDMVVIGLLLYWSTNAG